MRLCAISTAAVILLATYAAQAQTYRLKVLHTFSGGDGANPMAGVVMDIDGNLYGTTASGDQNGTVFELDRNGKEKVLHRFTSGADGSVPLAGVIRIASGSLYGVTEYGGTSGGGVIFSIDSNGKETVLYSFIASQNGYGDHPVGGLARDASGNLYGTTLYGGDTSCINSQGCGTVFKLDTSGTATVLHIFERLDGAYPYGRLLLDKTGSLYGTTQQGGFGGVCDGNYCGTVFKVDSGGKETVLYRFTDIEGDGYFPQAGLVRDAEGNFYGTTYYGGGSGFGTVFRLTGKGEETVLHNFAGLPGGANPSAPLTLDAEGNLYGTTVYGGPSNDGIVFKVAKSGKETMLYSFDGSDGAYPYAGVIRDKKGNLYGTTSEGGNRKCNPPYGCGTAFELSPR